MCVICKKFEGRLIVISEKAKNTLIKSSVARKDGREEDFSSISQLHVHSECRKQYTKPQLVRQAAKISEQVNAKLSSVNNCPMNYWKIKS